MSPLLRVELEEDPEEEQKEEDATLPIDVVSLEVLLNTPALRSNNDGTERAVDGGIKCEERERERERESSFVKERGFFSEEEEEQNVAFIICPHFFHLSNDRTRETRSAREENKDGEKPESGPLPNGLHESESLATRRSVHPSHPWIGFLDHDVRIGHEHDKMASEKRRRLVVCRRKKSRERH